MGRDPEEWLRDDGNGSLEAVRSLLKFANKFSNLTQSPIARYSYSIGTIDRCTFAAELELETMEPQW